MRWITTLALLPLLACEPVKATDGSVELEDSGAAPEDDADRDGFTTAIDCDDQDAAINPMAEDLCDGVDNDCDGEIDNGAEASTWYEDMDGDGYGADASAVSSCTQPSGWVGQGGDCDDTNPAYNPGATELDCEDPNDYNCDGSTGLTDADGDGWPACEDCDDGSAAVSPSGVEVCDDADNDCDGLTDDADEDTIGQPSWYRDADGDSYGDDADSVLACDAPEGTVAEGGDCDDADPAYNPAASEADCTDPNDYDCDGVVAWADADVDGVAACEDCDDEDGASYPGAEEVCDGADNDCDGLIDADDDGLVETLTWYRDADADGYGNSDRTATGCEAPEDYVAEAGDCDDGDDDINPAASELCDGEDNDCDGLTDDADDDLSGGGTFYEDADGDGYGADGSGVFACSAPDGYASTDGDCDDGEPEVNPGSTESCDALDNDCSGYADDGGVCPCSVNWYGDHPYMFCTSGEDWSTARSECEDYGYDLVTIDDASENTWIYGTASGISSRRAWWIGFTDSTTEGTWAWLDGGSTSYTSWASGEPNDGSGWYGGQDCAMLIPSYSDDWYDYYCSSDDYSYYTISYICEAE